MAGAILLEAAIKDIYNQDMLHNEGNQQKIAEAKKIIATEQEHASGAPDPNDPNKDDKKHKTVEDIIKDSKPGKETGGKSIQYEKPGNYNDTLKDFDTLELANIRDISDAKGIKQLGLLPNGQKVVARAHSSGGVPTLKIQPLEKGLRVLNEVAKVIKIRYMG